MIVKSVKGEVIMKINSITAQNKNNYYNQAFQMRLVQDPSMTKYINSLHSGSEQNNLRQTVNIIKNYMGNNPGNKNIKLAALHPSKAGYVKHGTYDEYFTNGKKTSKKVKDYYARENVYMQLEGSDKIQGFYMNPDENPHKVAGWFMDTFNYYKNSLMKKSV